MPEKLKFANRKEWLVGRRKGLGASEWAGALRPYLPKEDRDPYLSPYKIWCDKLGVIPENGKMSSSMEWGLRHEPTIAQAVADQTGREVILADEWSMYRADAPEWMQATPDALQRAPGKDGPGVLQIKTASFWKREEWVDEAGNERPPMYHQIQVQGEMRVTGCKWGSLAVLVGGNRLFGPYDFERNDAFIATAERLLGEFWARVLNHVPPEIDGCEADSEVVKAMYAKSNGKSMELPADLIPTVDEWRKVNEVKKTAEKREKELKTILAAAMGEADVGFLPDGRKLLLPVTNRSGYTVEATSFRTLKLA